jgi:hypothetical protein
MPEIPAHGLHRDVIFLWHNMVPHDEWINLIQAA